MSAPEKRFHAVLEALGVMLLSATAGLAQIPGLCNTGQTPKNADGCTGVLVTPNPTGGGPNRDGNWAIAHPFANTPSATEDPCLLSYVKSWVDTPNPSWMANSASTLSEWITPYDGESNQSHGYYVYATTFPVPDNPAPTGVTISGQLASDNPTVAIYLETPAGSGACYLVMDQLFPVNPPGQGSSDFEQWWPFTFTNGQTLAVASPAALYFVVQNVYDDCCQDGESPIGLRVEFFSTSAFH